MNFIYARLGLIPIRVNFIFFITLNYILSLIFIRNNYSFLYITISILTIYFVKIFIFKENKKEKLIGCFLIIFFHYLGHFLYNNQQKNFKQFQLLTENHCWDLIGKITNISAQEDSKMKYKITVKIEKIKNNRSYWLKLNNQIQVYTNYKRDLEVDDKVIIKNVFFKNINKELFKDFLIKENLASSIFIYKFNFKILERKQFSCARYIFDLKDKVLNKLKSKFNSTTFPLFSSIFLGNKNYSKKELENINDLFKTWGLSHYLARSGLHLIIITTTWYLILSIFFLSFKIKNLIISLLIYIYYILSWSSIPFIRSLMLFSFYKICTLLNLQINTFHLLNITTLAILLFNPIQLFFLDFQLSFGLTYALLLLSNITATCSTISSGRT